MQLARPKAIPLVMPSANIPSPRLEEDGRIIIRKCSATAQGILLKGCLETTMLYDSTCKKSQTPWPLDCEAIFFSM